MTFMVFLNDVFMQTVWHSPVFTVLFVVMAPLLVRGFDQDSGSSCIERCLSSERGKRGLRMRGGDLLLFLFQS